MKNIARPLTRGTGVGLLIASLLLLITTATPNASRRPPRESFSPAGRERLGASPPAVSAPVIQQQTCLTPQPPPAGASVKTDRGIYRAPAPPPLPPGRLQVLRPDFRD